ncbi:unnamed protein product [Cylindrotheca closterium]|uniref:Calcineurin-like phosphoesterase domain-containing protein n=1 Tax=Cylindrotheca closterium TaxID=2856 RepID=A0AAD2FFU1_9STRA|nr:unnamed protein product [Cylindrotheca closterium]
MARWNVGDSVQVRVDNDELIEASVLEARGAGWYSIELKDKTIIKCRASQLVPITSTALVSTTVETFSAKNRMRPTIAVEDDGSVIKVALPPPTIHDLDAALLATDHSTAKNEEFLKQVEHHASFEKWVAFTDLHCSPATLDTSLEVLEKVHSVAKENNAGVLFLGDFWHHRGTLRVDCLNAILNQFRSWEVPMVMIPGNHDQVTLDGHSHSLIPFENAYRVGGVPGPLVLSYPTKFRDALFIPHIRDIATMESVLQAPPALESSAFFIHAEVTGALMNDLLISTGGVPPASFPPNKKIYSGHFHKPHTVKASNVVIEYLGSPYEVSLAEAQQSKMLAIFDKDWNCEEYLPISIGRRHFKFSSWKDFLRHDLAEEESKERSVGKARSGDRMVVSVPKENSLSVSIATRINELREAGVTVEIRETKAKSLDKSELSGAKPVGEEMTPESTWKAYIEGEKERDILTEAKADSLLKEGLKLMEEIETNGGKLPEDSDAVTDLKLKSVSMEGFGPFQSRITYPLDNRGLVLLKGRNSDSGADSNGSGKTSLAMAALWALTGSMDARRANDGKVTDIINDYSKVARVTLEGSINGSPFSISRSKTPTKGNLVFLLDGDDLTTQSVKETQMMIEEKLGVDSQILSRTMFHGQHALNDMLESTDAKFKEELSLLVPIELWQSAATFARKKGRAAKGMVDELNGMHRVRSEDVAKILDRQHNAERVLQLKQDELESLQKESAMMEASEDLEKSSDEELAEIEEAMRLAAAEIELLEKTYATVTMEKESTLKPLQENLSSLEKSLDSLRAQSMAMERETHGASLRLTTAEEGISKLEQKWSVDLTAGIIPTELELPQTCPTCLQTIPDGAAAGHDHVHQNMQSVVQDEIATGLQSISSAQESLERLNQEAKENHENRMACETEIETLAKEVEKAKAHWDKQVKQANDAIVQKRLEFADLSQQMSTLAKGAQVIARYKAAQASLDAGIAAVQYANETYYTLTTQVEEGNDLLASLETQMQKQSNLVGIMGELSDRFGQRGVQSFVLQFIVSSLESIAQVYLDNLSDGSLRLGLEIDEGERISRTAQVIGSDGVFKDRPLSTLSGGQWRRCSLALSFAFAELFARRGKLKPSLCVLDEPLTHLDRVGRQKVGEVLRGMLRSDDDEFQGFGGLGMNTVLIILQDLAAEELDEAFDHIDEVVRDNGESYLNIDD